MDPRPSPGSLRSPPSPARGRGEDGTEVSVGPSPLPLAGEGGAQRRVRAVPKPGTASTRARRLRRDQNEAERRLWNLVRNRSVGGLKFTRQYPIGPFIADFVCRGHMLVLELDGSQHADEADHDRRRTAFLNARGYSVLRFWNNEVLYQLAGVHDLITAAAEGKELGPSPGWRFSPATLSPGGRGAAPTAL